MGDKMKVKVFDESHEKDLENSINGFLNSGEFDIIDIKFQVAIAVCGEEQIIVLVQWLSIIKAYTYYRWSLCLL